MAQGLTLQELQAMGAKPVATTTQKKGLTLQELQTMGAKPVAPQVSPEVSTGRKVAEAVAPSSTALFDYTRASSRLKSGEIAEMQKERESLLKRKDPEAMARVAEIDADVADVISKADKTFGQKAGMALGTGIELSGVAELGSLGMAAGRYGVRKVLGKAATDVAPKAVYTPFAGNKAVQAITKATTIAPKTASEEAAYRASTLGGKAKVIAKDTAKMMPEALGFGYGYDVSTGLQEGEGAGAFKPGAMTAIGGAVPGVVGGVRLAKNALTPSVSKSINSLEQTYADLMSGTTPGKKKISKLEQKTEMLDKAGTTGKTPMRTLAEQGIIPKRSGTKLDTFEQAQEYRNNISYLKDANKQALEQVGLSSQLTKLDDLEEAAVKYANSQRNIDSGRAPKMIKEIRTEFAHLKEAYPDGVIPVGKVDEIKSARWDNVFANKGLVDTDVLKKDSEYAIAKAMQKHIEEVADTAGNPEVAQLNREIGDRLEAAKFLEELNGKTIKGGRLLKYVTTAIGSTAGQTIPGKIIGALGGNIVGELMISRNVAGPIKRLILRNLETKDPEAYTKTIAWLQKQKLDKETRLLLPAGDYSKQAIPMGAKASLPVNTTANDFQQNLRQAKNTLSLPAPRGIPMGGQDIKGNIVLPSGQKTAKPLEFLPQSKSPTNAQTTNAINNPSNIPASVTPKKEMSPVDREAMDSMNYYFESTDGPQIINYISKDGEQVSYRTSTSMADFPDHLKSRALFNRVKPYWDKQEVPKSPLMKELYEELQKRMAQVKTKLERAKNAPVSSEMPDGQAFAGLPAGIQTDEEGNTTFDPKMAALGVAGMSMAGKMKSGINAGKVSAKLKNSLLNDASGKFNKPERFVGEKYSIKEAETGLAENGKYLKGRIVIGKDDKGRLILKDGTHLLEAYRDINKNIPEDKISFENGVTFEDIIDKSPVKNVLREGQPKISENGDTFDGVVARERFDIPNLEKISFGGSDRDVYDLGDNKVLKVIKSARGIEQNRFSSDYYAEGEGLIPKTYEVGDNYIVKEKVLPPDAATKKMIKDLQELPYSTKDNKYYEVIAKLDEKYGNEGLGMYNFNELLNYGDILVGDLKAGRNWGTTLEGKPVMLDEGTLNGSLITNHTTGGKNLDNPEFRSMYERSKDAKKKFGDIDAKTMYGIGGVGFLGATSLPKDNK